MKLEDYEIISIIHEDEKFKTYKAKSSEFGDKKIKIKITSKEYPENKEIKKLKNEFKYGNQIDSNYIIKYYKTFNSKNGLGLESEYFDGETLTSFIKKIHEKKLSSNDLKEMLEIAVKITKAIEAVHQKDILYKNWSPSNILYNSETKLLKIIDFSKAGYLANENILIKNYDFSIDYLTYISPELTRRINKVPDCRSDLYSMGVIFYELFTGVLPFKNNDPLELLYAHIATNIPEVSSINIEIPEIISKIIMKLLSKNPDERYITASGVIFDLEKCMNNIDNIQNLNFELGKNDYSNRFNIPEKLYGRQKEIEMLLSSFNNIKFNKSEIFLISGEPGIGKSSLVRELHHQIMSENAYFISGKFEQFQSDTPYSAIVYALRDFINQILLESKEKLQTWKYKILKTVGENGRILTDIIPSLKLIIGEQPEIPTLGASETQNRFNMVFENFIECISSVETPLVMFIDDWQWADSASLNFIKNFAVNKDNKALLVIGAYRDNDLELIKPILSLVEEFIENKIIKSIVHLKEIETSDIQNLLKDTLKTEKIETQKINELAEFIKYKTEGNPFFVKQFTKSLYENKQISFNFNSKEWQWNTEKIKNLSVTDNVVDLLIKKIKNLNEETIENLKYGACLGQYFNSEYLSLLKNKSLNSILDSLQPAINEGIIYIFEKEDKNNNGVEFKFIHDRIEQAVYSIISDEFKQNIHLEIGRCLLKLNSGKDDEVFEIVRHLSKGQNLITSEDELFNLAKFNFRAGVLAKKSAAYESAYNYFRFAIKLLKDNNWNVHYDFILELYINMVEACYLTSDYEKMDEFSEIILANAKTVSDSIPVYKTKIQAYQAQLKLQEALESCITALKLTGIDIPDSPEMKDIGEAIVSIKSTIMGKNPEYFKTLPKMTDPKHIAAMELLAGSMSVTYKASPMLTPILVGKMMTLISQYGDSPFSPIAYVSSALILCSLTNDINHIDSWGENIDLGYKLGRISIDLINRKEFKLQSPIVLEFDNMGIKHWKEHLRETLSGNIQGYWAGIENGNFEYGGYCLASHTFNSFFVGNPLNQQENDIIKYVEALKKIRHDMALNWTIIYGQLCLNLQGKSNNKLILTGKFCNEDELNSTISSIGDMVAMFNLKFCKMMLCYYFEDYSTASTLNDEVEKSIPGMAGSVHIVIFHFMNSLLNLALYKNSSENEKEEILKKISINQLKLKEWAKHAPMNFLHKFYLVEAELSRIQGKSENAVFNYENAIKFAKENKYLNDEALAYELAGKFYLENKDIKKAKSHLKEAYFKYQQWGAAAKTEHMKNLYPKFFDDINPSYEKEVNYIDMSALLKSTQAISKEINLESLIKKTIDILIKVTGSQKIMFFRKDSEELLIEAHVDKENDILEILNSTPFDEVKEFPKTVILYTARTGKTTFFPQEPNDNLFEKDSYILEKKPKSFLSTPIMLNNVINGVIYLENNLIENSFSKSIIEVVEILTSQAAISIQNAMMYNTLEEKVEERTKELEKINEQLKIEKEKAQAANRAKSEFLANVSHEIRTPMNTILGFTDILRGKLDNPKLTYYTDAVYSSGKILLDLINDILDLSKVEAGKLYVKKEAISIIKVIEEVEMIFENKIKENGLKFIKNISPNVPEILLLDETRIRQILINLVGNAVKFTDQGYIKVIVDTINLNLLENTTDLFISVQDTGIGIAEEHKNSIFEPFVQLNKVKLSSLAGTGLGLSISKRLIETMEGSIKVISEEEKGSEFNITLKDIQILPNHIYDNNIHKYLNISKIQFQNATIIIADDIEYNRVLLREFLEPYNFNIIEAADGKEVLNSLSLNKNNISLILLDIKMPVMDGYEVISILKSDNKTRNIPIIGITASILKHDEENLKKICDSYFLKPIAREELILKIMDYIPHEIEDQIENKVETLLINDELNTESVSLDSMIEYPELIIKLKNDRNYIEDLLQTMAMEEIEKYAENLLMTGRVSGSKFVRKLGEDLQDAVLNFEMNKIKTLLNKILEI